MSTSRAKETLEHLKPLKKVHKKEKLIKHGKYEIEINTEDSIVKRHQLDFF